ncbi:LrgB family protein [Acinetobacter qingfengensis]|uniref:Uncharacterized protein n=1 Tax=Acinetobacter qingfengensis TaxID=1262585 RepID=A0A1E7R415_9GAMM|nr:LrgB family protein [Acinetobacter qingfengensis]KAA8731474.1 LrgB family protein [Acinetobacter qingfengensis]OEY94031.1 hypothetical protein BJI46_13715 [Acinetobacter qingfengensis]
MNWISLFFFILTVILYFLAKKIYERKPFFLFSPIIFVPCIIISVLLISGMSFDEYYYYTKYLVWMLGPITITFAIPLYQYGHLIKHYFKVLCITSLVAIITGLLSSYLFAYLFSFNDVISKSLYVRSVSIPFALTITEQIQGSLSLVPLFTVITGLVGMICGDIILGKSSKRYILANGSALGNAAHAMGVAKAQQRDIQEAVIASLSLIISGVLLVVLSCLFLLFSQT